MAVAKGAVRAALEQELQVTGGVVHVALDRHPTDIVEMPDDRQIVGRSGLDRPMVVRIGEVLEGEVPPPVIVEQTFRSRILFAHALEIPLVMRVAGRGRELADVVADL
jgi:hypothetical protein